MSARDHARRALTGPAGEEPPDLEIVELLVALGIRPPGWKPPEPVPTPDGIRFYADGRIAMIDHPDLRLYTRPGRGSGQIDLWAHREGDEFAAVATLARADLDERGPEYFVDRAKHLADYVKGKGTPGSLIGAVETRRVRA